MFNDIKNARNILILPHLRADGDCLGSSFALKLILENMGKTVVLLTEEELLPKFKNIIFTGKECNYDGQFDAVIAVDSGDAARLGVRKRYFDEAFANPSAVTVCIDHHISNSGFAEKNYIDPKASSTGECLYNLCVENSIPFDREIANNLFVSIVSDTGRFMFANTSPRTFEAAAFLVKFGFDLQNININLFSSNTLAFYKLQKIAIDSLLMYCDNRVACVHLYADDVASAGASYDDCTDIISIARGIEGVLVAVFVREMGNGKVKVSLRSKFTSGVDVSKICCAYGGGGHVQAAAFDTDLDVISARDMIVEKLAEVLG